MPLVLRLLALLAALAPSVASAGEATSIYDPAWADAPALRTIHYVYDASQSSAANGAALADTIEDLVAGDRLVVGPGTYSIDRFFTVSLVGTASAPIRIEAEPGARPVLTRPNANQNVLNIGTPSSGPTRFLLLRGFEITGGSMGVRIEDCEDLWIDGCYIHHTGAVTVRANSQDTARLTITDNEIAFSSQVNDTGEGIYLGANFGARVTHGTVVARNHLHDLFQGQGDGIELKQGSYGCWIAENIVHDTNYPGIIAYGTAGEAPNLIERNVVWNANENAMQVQGEAIVRNNVVFGRSKPAFVSFDHQGTVRDLEVSHNTFVTTSGTAMRLASWSGRPGMRVWNNALYSESGDALFASGAGLGGVDVAGNVAFGRVVDQGAGGFAPGAGIGDFARASFDGALRDVRPAAGSALDSAAVPGVVDVDLSGATRGIAASAGAFERGTYGDYGGDPLSGVLGEPLLRATGQPVPGGAPVEVELSNAPAGQLAVLFVAPGIAGGARRVFGVTDAGGVARLDVALPGGPAFAGTEWRLVWAARDPGTAAGIVRTQTVVWR